MLRCLKAVTRLGLFCAKCSRYAKTIPVLGGLGWEQGRQVKKNTSMQAILHHSVTVTTTHHLPNAHHLAEVNIEEGHEGRKVTWFHGFKLLVFLSCEELCG